MPGANFINIVGHVEVVDRRATYVRRGSRGNPFLRRADVRLLDALSRDSQQSITVNADIVARGPQENEFFYSSNDDRMVSFSSIV